MILTFIPIEYLEMLCLDKYFGIDISSILSDRYWLIAVPTHFFVTLFYIFCMIQGWNYIITEENPVKEGKINKRLLNFKLYFILYYVPLLF